MVVTWATVGSLQVGERVHLGGECRAWALMLEPVQAAPVIIGDDCFISSRAIVVEGRTSAPQSRCWAPA